MSQKGSEAVDDAVEVFETACAFLMRYGTDALAAIEERLAWDRMRNDALSVQVWEDVAEAGRALLASRQCLSACHGREPSAQQEMADLCRARLWGPEERRRAG